MFLPEFFFSSKKIGHLDQNLANPGVITLQKGEEFFSYPVPEILNGLVGGVLKEGHFLFFEKRFDLFPPDFNQRPDKNSSAPEECPRGPGSPNPAKSA